MSARRPQRGFTLVELAIVIAIVGVLSTLAIVYMRPQTKAIDVATRFGDLVSEASRLATLYGPVRADVAEVHGTARTYIKATGTGPTFTIVLVLEEGPEPDTGILEQDIQSYDVADDTKGKVTAESYATEVGRYGNVTPLSTWGAFHVNCYPNGTCDPQTLFFSQATGPTGDRQARVSIMPLGAASYVRPDWN